MKLKNDQKGIIHVAYIVLIVLVAVVVGFVGWRVLKNSQNQTASTSNTQAENNSEMATTNGKKKTVYRNTNNTVTITVDKPEDWLVVNRKIEGEAPLPFNLMTVKSPKGTYLHIADPTGFGGGCSPDSQKYTLIKKIPTASENIYFTEYSTTSPDYLSTYLRIEDLSDAKPSHKALKEGESSTGVCENVSGFSAVGNNSGDFVMVTVSTLDYENKNQVVYSDISNDTEFIDMLKTLKVQ